MPASLFKYHADFACLLARHCTRYFEGRVAVLPSQTGRKIRKIYVHAIC